MLTIRICTRPSGVGRAFRAPQCSALCNTCEFSKEPRSEVTMTKLKPIYRVDKFIVPEGARDEFLSRIMETHRILRTQPGFLKDSILEQSGGPGKYNIVTVAEWTNQESI